MSDFSSAKVGDRVWSSRFGYGVVETVTSTPIGLHPNSDTKMGIKFDNQWAWYLIDGKQNGHDAFPTLFWDEVKITPPPKPKRKVKKVVEGWVNLYGESPDFKLPTSFGIFPTKEEAIRGRMECDFPRYKGGPIFIRHEYEVEE